MNKTGLWKLLVVLSVVFCAIYPIAVIGVAFDVQPSFSLAWAGSALLFLEGSLLVLAAFFVYGLRRSLLAAISIIVLSYIVEAVGVNTTFPFGAYRYTHILVPRLPGDVPLPVMFAWILIVLGAYSWVGTARLTLRGALLGALLATLLDLEIEPVAAYVVHYWQWLDPGTFNYYGVPLANFVAWFVVAFLLLLLVARIYTANRKRSAVPSLPLRLPTRLPRLLFIASLFMFGLVDLTHGYYAGVAFGLLAALLLFVLARLSPQR